MSSILGGTGGSNGVGLLQGRSSQKGTLVINGTPSSGPSQSTSAVTSNLISSGSTRESQERSGKFLTLSNIKRATEIASEGTSAIVSLREEQASLVAEIADSAYGERSAALSARVTDIEDEITRVVEGSTYNGQNLLTGPTTFNAALGDSDSSAGVSLPGIAAVLYVTLPSIGSQEDAVNNSETFNRLVQSAQSLQSAVQSVEEKAGKILETAVIAAKDDPNAPTEFSSAQEISQKIAFELTSPFVATSSKQQIVQATIGSLDPSRAQELLN